MRILPRHLLALCGLTAVLIASLWVFRKVRDDISAPNLMQRKDSHQSNHQPRTSTTDSGFSQTTRNTAALVGRAEPVITAPTSQVSAEYAPEILVVDRSETEPGFLVRLGIRALNDPESQARERAVLQLCAAGNEDVIPFLTASLRDSQPRVWRLALEGLRRFGKRVPVGPVAEMAVHDPDLQRREEIFTLIRDLADVGAEETPKLHSSMRDLGPRSTGSISKTPDGQAENLITRQE